MTTLFSFAPPGAGPPPVQFAYRVPGEPATGSGATPAMHVDLKFPQFGGPSVAWNWDVTGNAWRRNQNGSADVTTDGGQITAANVILQFVDYLIVGYETVAGISAPIPKAQLVGQGQALIFTDGMLVRANWTKPSATDVTRFTDAAGAAVKLTPGQTWVELAPNGTTANTR